MDGWTVLKNLRSKGVQIPVIVVTARDDMEDRKNAQAYGVNDYLTKPFRFQDLLRQICFHLQEA
jgi:DNA-binding response OmpR family regulator